MKETQAELKVFVLSVSWTSRGNMLNNFGALYEKPVDFMEGFFWDNSEVSDCCLLRKNLTHTLSEGIIKYDQCQLQVFRF